MQDTSKHAMPKEHAPAGTAGASLPWREFFVRLGDGTLQDAAAPSRDRAKAPRIRPAKDRRADTACR